MNTNELLTVAYNKIATALINTLHTQHTMKQSNITFRVYEGAKQNNYAYEVHFDEAFNFNGNSYSKFYFKTAEDMGKFFFEASTNNGVPKGATL